MAKLLVILGITGIQGGSVARTFLKDPSYKIRGVTRDPSKPESQALIAQGIEVVKGDTDDVDSLRAAFAGAHTIFGNTTFPGAFAYATEADKVKLKPGQSVREWCFETEVRQGKNVADAVAGVGEGLQLFVWSTLSNARRWSKGKYMGVYHFDSKAVVVDYIHETYPELAAKLSLLQMGLFTTNWKGGQAAVPWERRPDGSMLLRIPLIVPTDAGEFVHAITQVSPGKNVLAFADLMTWAEYVTLWSKVTGVPAAFEDSTVEDQDRLAPGGFGIEMAEMFAYAKEFGYWGAEDKSVVFARDLGVDIKCTSIEQYIKDEDWSELLARPVPA